ncbi:S-adenosyl-L-methionine-dependent methyltransferase [Aspergillus floccosus]
MCDTDSLYRFSPDPGYRSHEVKPESATIALSVRVIGAQDHNDHFKTASNSEEARFPRVPQDNRLLKLVSWPSGTLPLASSVYNRKGAEWLAKNALSIGLQTQERIQENGRIYQGQGIGSYLLPCDETELDRLDFMHALFVKVLNSPKPIHVLHPSNGRFLDLGCGTGIWAMEIAKAYPNAYVLGVDISAIQPGFHPKNCVFRVPFNYEYPWLVGEGQWDVIHMRMGCGSVSDWPRLYTRILDHLRCDAWFEQLEVNFEPRCNDRPLGKGPLFFWYQSLKAATEKSKREIAHSPEKTLWWLQEVGFSDISHEEYVLPMNPRKQPMCEKAARWYRAAFAESIQPLSIAPFTRAHGWTLEEIQSVVGPALAEALDPNTDFFYTLHVYKARKRPKDEALGGTIRP